MKVLGSVYGTPAGNQEWQHEVREDQTNIWRWLRREGEGKCGEQRYTGVKEDEEEMEKGAGNWRNDIGKGNSSREETKTRKTTGGGAAIHGTTFGCAFGCIRKRVWRRRRVEFKIEGVEDGAPESKAGSELANEAEWTTWRVMGSGKKRERSIGMEGNSKEGGGRGWDRIRIGVGKSIRWGINTTSCGRWSTQGHGRWDEAKTTSFWWGFCNQTEFK